MAKVTLFSSGGADWSAIWTGLLTLVEIWQVLELLGLAVFPAAHTGAKAGLGICQIPSARAKPTWCSSRFPQPLVPRFLTLPDICIFSVEISKPHTQIGG